MPVEKWKYNMWNKSVDSVYYRKGHTMTRMRMFDCVSLKHCYTLIARVNSCLVFQLIGSFEGRPRHSFDRILYKKLGFPS